MKDIIPETCIDALSVWDAQVPLTSIEMGGIGPGYEMAIQGLAFEMLRVELDVDWVATDTDADFYAKWEARIEPVISECDALPWGGFSGAQVGAAKHFVACVKRRGYRAALRDPAIADRLIQVCKLDLRK
jgi:hypothetical protein